MLQIQMEGLLLRSKVQGSCVSTKVCRFQSSVVVLFSGLLNAFLFFSIIFQFFLTCIDTYVYRKTSSFLCCTIVVLGGYLLSLYIFLADIAELNLPKTTKITFPNGKDDLMNFESTIKPDEGYYM